MFSFFAVLWLEIFNFMPYYFKILFYVAKGAGPEFFCERLFKIRSNGTLCPGWLETMIFLISAS
jgi:hypothetical protein